MLACAGGLDHTRSAARHSDLGLLQHYQGIPRKEPENSGDEDSPHTVPGSAGLLQGLQSAAVGRAESTPLAGVVPLLHLLPFHLPTFSCSSSFWWAADHILLTSYAHLRNICWKMRESDKSQRTCSVQSCNVAWSSNVKLCFATVVATVLMLHTAATKSIPFVMQRRCVALLAQIMWHIKRSLQLSFLWLSPCSLATMPSACNHDWNHCTLPNLWTAKV